MDILNPGQSAAFARRILLSSLGLCGCVPDLDSDESTITTPRVIAIQAEPAEVRGNQEVTYRALVVDAKGVTGAGSLTWFYCRAPKPLAELGPINQDCLRGSSGQLAKIDSGAKVQGTMPTDACSLFGPNPPPPVGDEPAGRPADPDQTGGYKIPIMLSFNLGGEQDILLYEQRVACSVAGVTPEVSIEFNERYKNNANPVIARVSVKRATRDEQVLANDEILEVEPGEKVALSVEWPSCPAKDACGDEICGPDETATECAQDCTTPLGCGGQERYLWFDTHRRELVVRRESMRLAWYGTSGAYKDERTGVSEDEAGKRSENGWTAPLRRGEETLWVVLRDARGGVGFREIRVRVHK